jgi:tetratricopeptide (TPR) repeat protein
MDSAVNRLMPPVPKNAAFYILERAHLLSEMGQYRKAVFDYNNYEGIMTPKMLTDRFYALRAQVELNAKMYQQALDDMLYAQTLAPKNAYYPQECARIYFIVGSYNEAITQAQKSLVLHPENLEAYRIMGLAYYQLGEKTSAQQIFKKLIEAGDESLKKYME